MEDTPQNQANRLIGSLGEYELTAERVFTRLKAAILDGTISPGQRLTEEGLAAQLGVSRTPVREAIKRLEAEGHLKVVPRRGIIVPRVTAEQVDELCAVREAMEGLAARLAAERVQAQEIARLRYLLDQMASLYEKGDVPALVRANLDFHITICKAARNALLLQMYGRLVDMLQILTLRLNLLRQDQSFPEHRAIFLAIEARDPAEAERLARLHVIRGRDFYLSNLIAQA
ncbi:MAG: GntR family transcriptional regulator [Chloroflexi bacterium]|nr:GntR family transcriptional regulator [Chloroflexota bacterium]MDA8188575.1 GntR family transcriptional regulator [Dehalococcoidales bacterium]